MLPWSRKRCRPAASLIFTSVAERPCARMSGGADRGPAPQGDEDAHRDQPRAVGLHRRHLLSATGYTGAGRVRKKELPRASTSSPTWSTHFPQDEVTKCRQPPQRQVSRQGSACGSSASTTFVFFGSHPYARACGDERSLAPSPGGVERFYPSTRRRTRFSPRRTSTLRDGADD